MNENLLTIFIDALRPDFISKTHTPYLYSFLSDNPNTELETILGYSDAIDATIFTGTYPDTNGYWMKYQYSPETSPFKNLIPNSEIVSMYQNSSVFVLPSLEEGVPRTILEAMSCGIPVVCSRLPQLVDIVEGCGLLVPVKDSQALADSISKVLSDSSLAEEFRENVRRNVVENHSWKDTVKKNGPAL